MKRAWNLRRNLPVISLCAVFVLGIVLFLQPGTTHAAPQTFMVTNTNDSGVGSLRQAILDANNNSNPNDQDIIEFAIPATGDILIQPQTRLEISESVLIDGFSQGDSEQNSALAPHPMNGTLRVEIDNQDAGHLLITSDNVTIQGISMRHGIDGDIKVVEASGFMLFGCYIGTDTTGLIGSSPNINPNPTASMLVLAGATNAEIGGTEAWKRNVFGPSYTANLIETTNSNGTAAGDIKIQGNSIGVGSDSVTSVHGTDTYEGHGIALLEGTYDVLVGGETEGEGNNISNFYIKGAVHAEKASNLEFYGNWFYNSGGNLDAGATNPSTITFAGVENVTFGSLAEFGGNEVAGLYRSGMTIIDAPDASESIGVVIEGNRFGYSYGDQELGNAHTNISVEDNTTAVVINNNIIHNARESYARGISIIDNANDIAVLQNSIYNNGNIGIDLGGDGPTVNDTNDTDGGPNSQLNYPTNLLYSENGSNTDIDYKLNVPAGEYRVEFFSNTQLDSSGYGEGETFIGAHNITKSGTGSRSFSHTVDGLNHQNITATVTEIITDNVTGFGATSEFSQPAEDATQIFDLGISKVLTNPEDVAIGATLDYEITVTNHGLAPVDIGGFDGSSFGTNHLFIDILPEELSYSGFSTDDALICGSVGPGSAAMFGSSLGNHSNDELVLCNYSGGSTILNENESVVVTIHVTVDEESDLDFTNYILGAYSSIEPDYTLIQDAISSGGDFVTYLLNNYANGNSTNNFDIAHYPDTDLSLTKELETSGSVEIGGTIRYVFTLTNSGDHPIDLSLYDGSGNPLTNMLILDILPPDLDYEGVVSGDVSCIWGGPGSASDFNPLFQQHANYSLLGCSYTGNEVLQSNDSKVVILEFSINDTSDLDFTNYAFAGVQQTDPDYLSAFIASDNLSADQDLIDVFLQDQEFNNFAIAEIGSDEPEPGDSGQDNEIDDDGGHEAQNEINDRLIENFLARTGESGFIMLMVMTAFVGLILIYAAYRLTNKAHLGHEA